MTSNQKLPLLEWVLERFENCCRIARQKEEPADRDSWMEDAEYFRQILVVLSGKQPSGRQPVETSEKQTLALDILALMTRHVLPQEFKQEVIALCSAVEPSAPGESDWHCVHCGRDNAPSETHCVQCEWSRKHTIAGVLHERGCFDHPCICGAVKTSCSRCGGSQVDPDPAYQPCKQCCPKAPEVRASDPHDGITPCPPESRCVECWPENGKPEHE